MSNKLILSLIGLGAAGTTLFTGSYVLAQSPSNQPSLVQQIAQKFGLNQADVQTVFDQNKQNRQTQMQAKFTAFLDQAVKDGKITEAQKQLILAKRQEIMNNKSKTRTDLQAWATQNNIDLKYLMGFPGRMGGFHGMKGMMR